LRTVHDYGARALPRRLLDDQRTTDRAVEGDLELLVALRAGESTGLVRRSADPEADHVASGEPTAGHRDLVAELRADVVDRHLTARVGPAADRRKKQAERH